MTNLSPPHAVGPAMLPGERPLWAVPRLVQVRRNHNRWAARETPKDCTLRFTPRSLRKSSEMREAKTAFGAALFLVVEAVGTTLRVDHDFRAAVVTGLILFATGFGYLGSSVTSLIFPNVTFLFFALEAAIMTRDLFCGVSPPWGYTDLMDGEVSATGTLGLGQGAQFCIRLCMPTVAGTKVVTRARPALPTALRVPWVLPEPAQLKAPQEVLGRGCLRGIMARLDALEQTEPTCSAFVDRVRDLARRFKFDAIHTLLTLKEAPRHA